MMASAATEQSMSGHMAQPPVLINSNMCAPRVKKCG
jgi:hypothetical protein